MAFWIWSIVDVIRRDFPNPNDKMIWLIVIVLLGVLGSIIYLIAGRSKGHIAQHTGAQPTTPVEASPVTPQAVEENKAPNPPKPGETSDNTQENK